MAGAARRDPIFATEISAARLLDMQPAEFRELVEAGHLPPPVAIGSLRRFDVEELRRVIRGQAVAEGMEW